MTTYYDRVPLALWELPVLYLGLGIVLVQFYRLVKWLLSYRETDLARIRYKRGEYAIVTGCTDGIGLEIARYLHDIGYGLILVGRSESKLHSLASQLDNSDIVVWDCNTPIGEAKSLAAVVENRTIGVLVNNVGVCHEKAAFGNLGQLDISMGINVNVTAATDLTHYVLATHNRRNQLLGAMREYRAADDILIINVSSGSSLAPCPYLSIYSATKAYMTQWSRSLRLELRVTMPRARVVTLTPYYIATNMSRLSPTITIPSASHYVTSMMKLLHIDEGCGYAIHDMMLWVMKIMPQSIMEDYVLSNNRPD